MEAQREKTLALGILAAVLALGYLAVGHGMTAHPRPLLILTPWDHRIPLIPWTVWYYLVGLYVPILLVPFIVRDRVRYFSALTLAAVVALGAFVIFALWPQAYATPELLLGTPLQGELPYAVWGGDPLSVGMLKGIYRIDASVNTCPSLHVAFAFLYPFFLRDRPVWCAVMLVNAVLIAVSTLTTKQHFLADSVAALLWIWLCARVTWRPIVVYWRKNLGEGGARGGARAPSPPSKD